MTDNVISIEGQSGGTIFKAPADNDAARALWVFLVENLRPGFAVELSNSISELTRMSGSKLPPDLYAKVMGETRGQVQGYNLILIEKEGAEDMIFFNAPHNDLAAKSLWYFLVDNLQSGFVVDWYRALKIIDPFGKEKLQTATDPVLTWRSADKMPPDLYAKVMGGGKRPLT